MSVMDSLFTEGSWATPDSHHVLSLLTLNEISVKHEVQPFFNLIGNQYVVTGHADESRSW